VLEDTFYFDIYQYSHMALVTREKEIVVEVHMYYWERTTLNEK